MLDANYLELNNLITFNTGQANSEMVNVTSHV
jgi:hypothetical protein